MMTLKRSFVGMATLNFVSFHLQNSFYVTTFIVREKLTLLQIPLSSLNDID
jgi:hypothetical protein